MLTFFFRGIWEWRQKICFNYDSKRDVAASILHDTFIHDATAHYEQVGVAVLQGADEILEIYRRPENQAIISQLAFSLEKSNEIRDTTDIWTSRANTPSTRFGSQLCCSACPVANIWLRVPTSLVWIWALLLIGSFAVFVSTVSALLYFDGKFFRIVNNMIKPEND